MGSDMFLDEIRSVVNETYGEWKYRDGEDAIPDMVELLLEVAQLRAKWDAIPWDALQVAVSLSFMALVSNKSYSLDAQIWIEQNAPKESAK